MSEFNFENAINWNKYYEILQGTHFYHEIGKVVRIVGNVVEAFIPGACIGSICEIYSATGNEPIIAEAVGFKDKRVLLMPMGNVRGIKMGSEVILKSLKVTARVGPEVIGRVINSLGEPIDNKGDLNVVDEVQIYKQPYDPIKRRIISKSLDLGVRSINGFITAGEGQRLGIFAAAGCGKSILLGMIARNTTADINVVALIGERNREVRNFIDKELGPEGMKNTVLVVATSEQSPIVRVRAAYYAAAIAEYFRDQGKKVLLMMDSITRYIMAMREIGLAAGEPPATKGYPPSVFSELPKIFERVSTTSGEGSITGLYTVLMETEDLEDPIVDVVKSIIDGHILLTRKLASRGHYPAVDVLKSISRVMIDVVDKEFMDISRRIRRFLALYSEVEDLLNLGAYVTGSNPEIDLAIKLFPKIQSFLAQDIKEKSNLVETFTYMKKILLEEGVKI